MERANGLLGQFATRDAAAAQMRALRDGRFDAIAPGSFSEDYPAPIVANRIDTMARDMAATLTPLPSFNCVPTNNLQDKAKAFAAKRTKIARGYIEDSNLGAQMPDVAESGNTYGIFALAVEPDWECKKPKIRQVDGSMVYPVWDKNLCTVEVAYVQFVNIYTLEANFPDEGRKVRDNPQGLNLEKIRVVHYENDKIVLAYLPDANNQVLLSMPNKLGKCSFICAPRPSGRGTWSAVPRGAYDDLIWPMMAANEFRMLALEGTAKAVQAPLAVPMDVTDVSYGPDAVIHSSTPQLIQRVGAEIPTQAFQVGDVLDRDMQVGGMSPGSRSGSIDASVITGRGVQALGEGYSQQVAMLQIRLAWVLKQAIGTCFEMDEKFWPNDEKEIIYRSSDSAALKYIPSRDIAGDHTVDVEYGFLLGLDANRALVYILQAQAAGLISVDTAGRNLPMPLNMAEESNKIQLEQLRASLIASVAALGQAIPQMAMQGQDPTEVIQKISNAIEAVKKGKPIETSLSEVFAPPPPAPTEQAAAPLPGAVGPGGSEQGGGPQPQGALPQQKGGRPDLNLMFAGLTGAGNANLSANVSRMRPVAGAA